MTRHIQLAPPPRTDFVIDQTHEPWKRGRWKLRVATGALVAFYVVVAALAVWGLS